MEGNNKMNKIIVSRILITLIMMLLVSSAFSTSSSIGIYLLYFLPIVIVILAIQVYFDLKQYEMETCVIVISVLTILVCFPIFLGVYFGIFYPIFSLHVEKVENCQVIGVAPMNQAGLEVYTILYVDFQYEGQSFLGYACSSDKYDDPNMYQILNYGDFIQCDNVGSSFEAVQKRLLNSQLEQKDQNSRVRMLSRVRGKCQQRGKAFTSEYNFSKVKLSSWMCINKNISYDELVQKKECYISFYKDRHQAYKNSKERANLKDVYHFALTQFEVPNYFPKTSFICLIVFTYIPFLINFYHISIFITNGIEKLIKKRNRFNLTNEFKFPSYNIKLD